MNETLVSILVVLALILFQAFFVAAEIALISLREGQVKAMASSGRRGAAVARLVADPNRFLAAVQIGVTLTALLASAYGAVTLSATLSDSLARRGVSERLAGFLGIVGVTVAISFVTLVIGELVPKRLALQRSESMAKLSAPFLNGLVALARPVIWLLSACTDLVVRLLGGDPDVGRGTITVEELRGLVSTHEELGSDERRLIQDVFTTGERQLREVMVPRTEVDFLDASTPVYKAVRVSAEHPHSRYPVVRGSHDDVIGFVHVRDLFAPELAGRSVRVGDVVREIKLLPATKRVLPALSEMRREGHHLAIVVDEYGGTAGIVTLEDLVEELVGDIRDEYDLEPARLTRLLAGGALEVEGLLNLADFAEETGVGLPQGPYETVGGFLMAALGHVPAAEDSVQVPGYRLTVIEMDGRRVARVRLTPDPVVEPDAEPTDAEPAEAETPEGATQGDRTEPNGTEPNGTEPGGTGPGGDDEAAEAETRPA